MVLLVIWKKSVLCIYIGPRYTDNGICHFSTRVVLFVCGVIPQCQLTCYLSEVLFQVYICFENIYLLVFGHLLLLHYTGMLS